jgi:hypothetical protein
LDHRQIKAKTLGIPFGGSRDRTELVSADNPDVLSEARGAQPAQVNQGSARLKSGPAWHSGLRAWGGPEHHPGKMDGPDVGRRKVITY